MSRPRVRKILVLLFSFSIIAVAGWKGIEATSADSFCTACHIMKPMADSADHTIHRMPGVSCKDCHLPHDNVVKMLGFKAYSGLRDLAINAVDPPETVKASAATEQIVQSNCIRCHRSTVQNINTGNQPCYKCHRSIPHENAGL